MRDSFFLIGCGAVGTSLGKAISDSGGEIVGVFDLVGDRALEASALLETSAFHGTLPVELRLATVVLVAVTDHAIVNVAGQAVDSGVCSQDQIWLHCSGRLNAEALGSLEDKVLGYGSMHPALVFPPGKVSPISAGACFAVDGNSKAMNKAHDLVRELGGKAVEIPANKRAAYHASMVMASNYVVALLAQARGVLDSSGVDLEEIEPLLLSLSQSALRSAHELGIDESLSGPIRRGDIGAVEENLKALKVAPKARELYAAMGKATVDMVLRMKNVDKEMLLKIMGLFDSEG